MKNTDRTTMEGIARIVHTMIKMFCESTGDAAKQSHWENISDEHKESMIDGVREVIENPDITPEEMHENWIEYKKAHGWKLGDVKDYEAKTHTCMVPYQQLSRNEQHKDKLIISSVKFATRTLFI